MGGLRPILAQSPEGPGSTDFCGSSHPDFPIPKTSLSDVSAEQLIYSVVCFPIALETGSSSCTYACSPAFA